MGEALKTKFIGNIITPPTSPNVFISKTQKLIINYNMESESFVFATGQRQM